jgi:hypothetical protein
MGGDEVYPTPTPERYERRLVGPYAAALPYDRTMKNEARPKLYAIPGNHDWYDGLGAFMNLFSAGEHLGNWHMPQQRSCFALALPFRTWLIAVDVQLFSDTDTAQIDAFLKLKGLSPGDRVILCSPEPDWQYRAPNVRGEKAAPRNLDRLRAALERNGLTIVLQLAGDQHHYRRQSDDADETHLVTAGGGGAFLHPTHTNAPAPVTLLGRRYTCRRKTEFPSRRRSRAIAWKDWAFPALNPLFGLATALVYVILGLVMPRPDDAGGTLERRGAGALLLEGLARVAESPSSMAWVLFIVLAFFAFTDTHKRVYRYLAGLGHASAHLVCALAGGIAGTHVRALVSAKVVALLSGADGWVAEKVAVVASSLAYVAAVGAWGYVFGALIFGAYLWISVYVFGRHGNEAFSAIKHEGHKNFLRLRIAEDAIEVFAIGLEKVPPAKAYTWRDGSFHADGAPPLRPILLDRFTARVPRKRRGAPAASR